ncbi:GFA family protein [Altererythrobacter sp. KTW20L]|uniref:GFA family protein n=1 Tax=Altererythrobacter sp. KTW20L TaxID=2942210 RepID=UPI0020C0DBB1|nr:GFA family protein [Altererythrobacter sp. KTW20L]MCL6251255.1 GFA family protein [Altererythrobacter sp. KTW20L]
MTVGEGGCHCGQVRFAVDLPDELKPSRCNCSICAKKGAAMVYVPLAALTITAGEDVLKAYRFNTGVAQHWFCSNCGIHCFHQARSDPHLYAISAATIDGVAVYEDFAEMPVNDGQHHSLDNDGVRSLAGTLKFAPSPDGKWARDGW